MTKAPAIEGSGQGLPIPGWVLGTATCLAIAALQLAVERATVKAYDEGLLLYGGARVASGAVPYRDFWSLYGPGGFYVLAALDRLFGESVLVARIFDATVRAGIVMLMHRLIVRRAGRAAGLIVGCLGFALLAGVREYLFPALPATALALLALYALGSALAPNGAARDWALCGAAIGVAFLFRPDFGAAALLACLWAAFAQDPFGNSVRDKRGRDVSILLGAALGVCVPPFLYLAIEASPSSLYQNLVGIPASVYVANRGLPLPDIPWAFHLLIVDRSPRAVLALAVYFPLLVGGLGTLLAVVRRVRGSEAVSATEQTARRLFEASVVLQLLLCFKGMIRVDLVQMLPALLVSVVLAGLALPGERWRHARMSWRAAGIGILALCLASAAGLVAAARVERVGNPPLLWLLAALKCDTPDLPRLGCFVVDPDRAAVLHYLALHAHPGDTLFVGAGRHDKLFANNVELYFLSGLQAATKWSDLHPGVQTTETVQRAMVAEMSARPPAFVVRNTEWDAKDEPNASRLSSGVLLLDRYLDTNYTPVYRVGTYTLSAPGVRVSH